MDAYVRTRWTHDGLVEIAVDVTTASELREALAHVDNKVHFEGGCKQMLSALSTTLDVKGKQL